MPQPPSIRPKPVVLLILDGWGHREETADNALALAKLPHWRGLLATCPHTLIHTEGRHVGLPDGQMGNSEVGHMNLGAGRIVYQDLTRIDAAIEDGSFFGNPELTAACEAVKQTGATLHVIGLLSPGGVHSHERHIFAMLELAARFEVAKVAVHALLDGRDTPPRSAEASLRALQALCERLGNARIASVGGRYFAMDRDHRWERVRRGWDAIVEAQAECYSHDALAALQAAYARGENDEFVAPTVLDGSQPIRDGDAVVFMNFRADRARQLSAAFVAPGFDGFDARRPALSRFVCLTEYDAKLPAPVAFAPDDLRHTFGELLAEQGMTQLRIAETEKYAHVTFFFNGGVETQFPGEDRILVPSPREVATYDLKPQMSAEEVADKFVDAVDKYDVVIMNFANGDMVGHTGFVEAGVAACEAVDSALEKCVKKVLALGGKLLITADHGNAEHMRNEDGSPNTAHTTNLVDLIYVADDKDQVNLSNGILADVAPTLLNLMGLKQPAEMSGHSLVTPGK